MIAEADIVPQDVFRIELLPAQYDALTADEPFVAYVGGIGSGKTYLGSRWLVSEMVAYPDGCHVATANTYPQMHDVVAPNLIEALDERGIPYVWKASERAFIVAGGASRILCRSLEKPHRLRGLEIDRWWGDEARDYSADAWTVMIGRMRGRRSDRPRAMLTTTPNGFGEVHKRFVEYAGPDYRVVSARTRDNPHLPEGYEESVRAAYKGTPELADQELDGKFVAVGRLRACRSFDRKKHVRPLQFAPGARTIYTLDWNVGRVSLLVVQEAAGEIRFVREVRAKFSEAVASAAVEAVRATTSEGRVVLPATVDVYGDSGQGAERSVQTGRTVWDDFFLRIAEVRPVRKWPSTNPRVVERVASTNYVFETMPVFVDPSCAEFIADLERTQWDEDGKSIDDSDPDRGHFFDAAGYYLHQCHRPSAFRRPTEAVGYYGESMRSALA